MDERRTYWRAAEPKPSYEVVIVGGGGHGLATAYYLAKNHGITDVCVVEKGWLGGGNMARNTTIIRSNYLWDESAGDLRALAEALGGTRGGARRPTLKFSQRGVLNLAHDLGDVRSSMRRVNANRLNGVDAEWLDAEEVEGVLPDREHLARRPLPGARRRRCSGAAASRGTTRSPGAMRRARRRLGVDIVEHCEVTGFLRGARRPRRGVETTRGTIRGEQVAPWRPPATRRCWRRWPDFGCRCSRIRCRRWCREPSSRCSTAS